MPNASRGLQPPELLAESGQLACTQGGSEGNTGIGPFGVYVLATDDFREQTALYFQVLQSPGEGLKILVCSDQSRSSVAPNLDKAAFGSFIRLYESDQFLTLRILVRFHYHFHFVFFFLFSFCVNKILRRNGSPRIIKQGLRDRLINMINVNSWIGENGA